MFLSFYSNILFTMKKENFEITAFFYNSDNLEFRRYLEIRRKGFDHIKKNDLTVIMMNPGSSKPKDIDNDFLDKFVTSHPDITQYQIMKVMNNCNLNYAKIINLSDIRSSSSNDFYKMLSNELKEIDHSIFEDSNDKHLKGYLNIESKFILGWGVNKKLTKLSKKALEKLERLSVKLFGLKHSKNKYGYYHPLPRNKQKQLEWVDKITKLIKDNSEH